MKVLTTLLFIVSCCSLCSQAAEEGGGSEGSANSASGCLISRVKLDSIFRGLFSEELTVYANCLSFTKTGALEQGVLSGINETGGPGLRLVLGCVEGVITTKPSQLLPSALNMTSTACLECSDTAVDSDVCNGSCVSPCERCYGDVDSCTRCIACVEEEVDHCYLEEESHEEHLESGSCRTACTVELNTVTNPDRFNYCECTPGHKRQLLEYLPATGEEEEVLPDHCNYFPELEPYRCVASCEDNNRASFGLNEELQICFACGLPYCLQCKLGGKDDEGEPKFICLQCLRETEIYDNECYACPRALVVLHAEEQKKELEEEEADQNTRQLELAISLPILTVLVILFFLGMSAFAHYRYPHVNPQGHKRHRTKPEDFDNLVSPPEDETPGDLELAPADVWRARPTIRLR